MICVSRQGRGALGREALGRGALGRGALGRAGCTCVLALAVAMGAAAPTAARPRRTARATGARRHARAASYLHASDVATLHYVGAFGEQVYETGYAKGTLPGSIRVHMTFASTVSGSFTIYTHNGRIDGHGRGKPHGGGVWESFAGMLVVTGGTGRYQHARGRAHLYGTFNRDSYALKIKTAGTLRF